MSARLTYIDPDEDEPECDDEDGTVAEFDDGPEPDDGPCEDAASRAEDRWIAERDAVASQ